jgi:hypothetical protein
MLNQDTGDHSIHPPVPNNENASDFGFGKQDAGGSRCPNFCDGVALFGTAPASQTRRPAAVHSPKQSEKLNGATAISASLNTASVRTGR